MARNLNSTLSTVAREPVDPDAAPAVSNSRLSARTAESIAQARKERKAAQGTKKAPNAAGGSKAKGSDDESSAEENENQQKNKMMKASDLGAPREMSRREKEQADKIAAKERYAKLHAAGKVRSGFRYYLEFEACGRHNWTITILKSDVRSRSETNTDCYL